MFASSLLTFATRVLPLVLLLNSFAYAESVNDCEKKSTKDAQYLCTAVSMVNPVVCEQISTPDGVHHCKAIAGANSYGCDKIQSPGKRQSCMMNIRDIQRSKMYNVGGVSSIGMIR